MNTSFNWIKDLVPGLSVSAQEYMEAMTLSGSKGEAYHVLDENLEKIVIGQIKSIEKHPNADRLLICKVDVGAEEDLQIVTGAPNVFSGAKVPVVLDGGRVAGGHDGSKPKGGIPIKAGRLRGADSCGMLCSVEELGSDRNMFPDAPEDGIYILDEEAPIGEDAAAYLGLRDVIHEYEITGNRVDCFSVLGIAREAAATFDLPFAPPQVGPTGNEEDISSYMTAVTVQCEDLCRRYIGRVVKNIHLMPSPKWMQTRLRASGIRPINNVVDITNYVMVEYGQPMHAYDLSTISGHKIIVRRAKEGETFTTLDGQERTLSADVCMICDGKRAVGIGGIMGGENSMITQSVQTILFEAANFDGANIRRSAKSIGMRTDASSKFEKGLDPQLAQEAMDRACQLIEELGAGEVVGGEIDVYPHPVEPVFIPFEPDKYNRLLGISLSPETMLSYFSREGLEYDAHRGEVIVPTYRQDLRNDADLAEEVARFFGYDKIPTTLPHGQTTAGGKSFKQRIESLAMDVSEACGFSQAVTFSFESPKVFDTLRLPKEDPLRRAIVIANPLGEDYSIMRTTPLPGMLSSLSLNYGRRNQNVRLYELAKVYLPKSLPLEKLPDERVELTFGCYGDGDFYEMKGAVESFLTAAGLKKKPVYDPKSGRPYLHPGRQANILYDGVLLGYAGEVHPDVAEAYGIRDRVCAAVMDMREVTERADFSHKYEEIKNFPVSTRDISLVVQKDILVGDIEAMILQRGGKYLESAELFDVYEGEQIKEGYKSVAFSLRFRGKDRNLEEADITSAMKKIMNGLEHMGITLRG